MAEILKWGTLEIRKDGWQFCSGVQKDNENDKEKEEGRRRCLLANFGIDDERYRAVVDECDLHHGGELSGGDRPAERGGHLRDKGLIERLGEGRGGGGVEGRARAFARAGEKRELADDQDATANIHDGAVHLTCVVGENAEFGELLGEPFAVLGGVVLCDSEQYEQAGPNLAVDHAVYRDAGGGNTLDNGTHEEDVKRAVIGGLAFLLGTNK